MHESDLIWTYEETRPRLRRKTNTGDGTTKEKKKRQTETETGCVNRDMIATGTAEDEVHGISGCNYGSQASRRNLVFESSCFVVQTYLFRV